MEIDCIIGNRIEFVATGETDAFLTDRTRYHYIDTILEIARSVRAQGTHTCEHDFGKDNFTSLTTDQPPEWWDRLGGEAERVARSLADLTFTKATSVAQEIILYVAAEHLYNLIENDLSADEYLDEIVPHTFSRQDSDYCYAEMLRELLVTTNVRLLFSPQDDRRLPDIYYTPEDWFLPRLHDL